MAMSNGGLSKLVEECAELGQIAAKKIAYMFTDHHPDGKGSMKSRLEEEIGDVIAACVFVVEKFGLDSKAIADRSERKIALFRKWDNQP